jgi:Tol biopolymer transport system component
MLSRLFKGLTNRAQTTRIAYERTGEGISGLPRGLFTINPDGSDCRQIRDSGESPKWSPDGRWISFVEKTEDNGWLHSVFVMRPNGTSERRLTFHHDVTATPGAWSPDSKWLAYSLWLWQEKKYELCVVEIATAKWKQLFKSECEIYPVWSPSNRIIFRQYGESSASRLFEVDSDGKSLQPCSIFQPGDDEPVWTFHGSQLVCGSNDGMLVMKADGSARRVVRSARGAIQWALSPDGQSVVYSSSRESLNSGFEVFIVDLRDETKRRLVSNPMKGDKEVDSRCVSWSPWL